MRGFFIDSVVLNSLFNLMDNFIPLSLNERLAAFATADAPASAKSFPPHWGIPRSMVGKSPQFIDGMALEGEMILRDGGFFMGQKIPFDSKDVDRLFNGAVALAKTVDNEDIKPASLQAIKECIPALEHMATYHAHVTDTARGLITAAEERKIVLTSHFEKAIESGDIDKLAEFYPSFAELIIGPQPDEIDNDIYTEENVSDIRMQKYKQESRSLMARIFEACGQSPNHFRSEMGAPDDIAKCDNEISMLSKAMRKNQAVVLDTQKFCLELNTAITGEQPQTFPSRNSGPREDGQTAKIYHLSF
jgi:hypothetical protein